MKIIPVGLALMIGCTSTCAQQAPQAASEHTRQMAVLPDTPIGTQPRPPPDSELAGLVRAQTEAIKALSGKLEHLEQRIEKLEASEAP